MFKWFVLASKPMKVAVIAASGALIGGAIAIPVSLSLSPESLKISASKVNLSTETNKPRASSTAVNTPMPSGSSATTKGDADSGNSANVSPDIPQETRQAEAEETQEPVETYTLCIASSGDRLYVECPGATCAFDVIVQGGWNWGAAGGNPRCNQDLFAYLEEHCNQPFIDSFDSWRKDVLIQRCEQHRTGTLF